MGSSRLRLRGLLSDRLPPICAYPFLSRSDDADEQGSSGRESTGGNQCEHVQHDPKQAGELACRPIDPGEHPPAEEPDRGPSGRKPHRPVGCSDDRSPDTSNDKYHPPTKGERRHGKDNSEEDDGNKMYWSAQRLFPSEREGMGSDPILQSGLPSRKSPADATALVAPKCHHRIHPRRPSSWEKTGDARDSR